MVVNRVNPWPFGVRDPAGPEPGMLDKVNLRVNINLEVK